MQLITGIPDHYCVQKIKVTAALTSTAISIVAANESKSIILRTHDGDLTQHNAILKYLAANSPSSGLSGANEFEMALIVQWLELFWSDIELGIQIFTSIHSNLPQFSLQPEEKSRISSETKVQIFAALNLVDAHLCTRTFLVGERLTLADISFLCICLSLASHDLIDTSMHHAIYRWFRTCFGMKELVKAFGKDFSSSLKNPHPSPSSSSSSSSIPNVMESGSWTRGRIRVKELLLQDTSAVGRVVTVKGWIRNSRSAGNDTLQFIELNDGSSVKGIQLVLDVNKSIGFQDVFACGGVGASLAIKGEVVASLGKGQTIEIAVRTARVLGPVYGGEGGSVGGKYYPMAGKNNSFEFLREKAHLRARTKVFSSTMRVRNAMAFATHKFFFDRGFIYTYYKTSLSIKSHFISLIHPSLFVFSIRLFSIEACHLTSLIAF